MKNTGLRYSMRDFFFDRAAVLDAVTKAEAKSLSKIGASIRQVAMYDMLRRRNSTSAPGSPPSVHSRNKFASLRNIYFAYLPSEHSVIVGPVGFGKSTTPVPSLLERGGQTTVLVEAVRGMPGMYRVVSADKRGRASHLRRMYARYVARPFMGPSLQKVAGSSKITQAIQGSLRP